MCVTSNRDIDAVIALARIPNVTIATFGDMTRVPGSTSSLLKEQAAGRSVQICYSPLDALALAKANPDREIVFVGVGFETTTPLVAMAIKRAAAMGLKNFSVFAAHKNMPGALETLVKDPDLKLDALILQGNPVALAAIDEVFETCTATWRGLGDIPGSGYRIREKFAQFDALKRFQPEIEPTINPKGCRCGDVLRARMEPSECPLFRKVCTPENPVGPCMVSSEGSCAAYYRYY